MMTDNNDYDYSTLLFAATKGNNVEALKLALDKDDINRRLPSGKTALMLAAENGCLEALQFLIAKNADIHIKDDTAFTAIAYAADYGNLACLEALIKGYPSIEKEIDEALLMAMESLTLSPGMTPNHCVKLLACINFLLSHTSDINIENQAGYSPLMLAIENESMDLLNSILAKKPDLEIENCRGDNALLLAAQQGNLDIVKALLDAGANLGYNKHGISIIERIRDMAGDEWGEDNAKQDILDYISFHTQKEILLDMILDEHNENNKCHIAL